MNKEYTNKIIVITGPTAIGKTRLAIKLARKIDGEIISCDSMQIYNAMPILSQAPSGSEKREARHHLVGILRPEDECSAAFFRDKAGRAVRSVIKRGKFPILSGGSGLYMKAIIDGLFPSPEADMKFRGAMERFCLKNGSAALYDKLKDIDPGSARSIHPNDKRRIIRALEIYKLSGRTMTELKEETKGLKDLYDIKIFVLNAPLEIVYDNINKRVDRMFEEGLTREVKRLRRRKLSKTASCVIGLREAAAYIDGEMDTGRVKEMIKMNTRNFARRQLTWFRALKGAEWIDVTEYSDSEIVRKIAGA